MSKLTVEQAWQHVKALWPDAAFIIKNGLHPGTIYQCKESFCEQHADFTARIDWPEGVIRWPPREPTYREPTQADVGKMVEVRDAEHETWKKKVLLAILPPHYECRYIVDNTRYDTEGCFDYFVYARIAVDGAQTDDKSSASESQSCPIDEANTARLAQLKEPTHPEAQPIATAPKDRAVWLWNGRKWFVGWWSNFDWDKIGAKQITHWREIK